MNHVCHTQNGFTAQELKAALIKAHHSFVTLEQVLSVLELSQVPGDFRVDVKLFAALCCLTERMFNLYDLSVLATVIVPMHDLSLSLSRPIAKKELIETVDFEALDWKLKDCSVNKPLHRLLVSL